MTTRDLFSDAGREAIAGAVRDAWLLAFDFDGTLAPFTDQPGDSAIPAAIHADLAALASRRTVAVISGRARADLLPRLPAGIAHVIGNHGCEEPDGDPRLLAEALAIARHWHDDLEILTAGTGLRIESKGPSLALHWRGVPNPGHAATIAAAAATHLLPRPQLIAGDQVLNLLPAGLPDKGTALLRLLDRTGRPGALFIGDDITDAAVFRLRDPGILGIEVGDKGLGADWRLPDTAAVGDLIHQLVLITAPRSGA